MPRTTSATTKPAPLSAVECVRARALYVLLRKHTDTAAPLSAVIRGKASDLGYYITTRATGRDALVIAEAFRVWALERGCDATEGKPVAPVSGPFTVQRVEPIHCAIGGKLPLSGTLQVRDEPEGGAS